VLLAILPVARSNIRLRATTNRRTPATPPTILPFHSEANQQKKLRIIANEKYLIIIGNKYFSGANTNLKKLSLKT
jgi:hypothetical protein